MAKYFIRKLIGRDIQSIMAGKIEHHNSEAAGHIPSQEAERDEHWCSASFLLFMQSRTPAHGVVLPTFRVDLPTSVSLI